MFVYSGLELTFVHYEKYTTEVKKAFSTPVISESRQLGLESVYYTETSKKDEPNHGIQQGLTFVFANPTCEFLVS